jgi:chlorite dismutase
MSNDKSKNYQSGTKNDKDSTNIPTTYLNFSFYKVDSKWRWLNDIGKDEAAKEFSSLIDVANTKMKVRTYSTVGLRKESDFMLWSISDSIEKIQLLTSKVYTTVLGKYIDTSEVYLSAARPSIYSNKTTPGFMEDELPLKYNIVYPFIKSREWYLLPYEKRSEMMKEHINVGRKFPQIRLNTSYSFGIGDQDFMLAFETDNLMDFQELIIKLRETQVSRYIVRDTPMIVCVHKKIFDIIKSLG